MTNVNIAAVLTFVIIRCIHSAEHHPRGSGCSAFCTPKGHARPQRLVRRARQDAVTPGYRSSEQASRRRGRTANPGMTAKHPP